MLEFFRHHRGAFLIFLTVIIIISFSFWGGWTRARGGATSPNDTAFTIYGRNYTRAEAQRFDRLLGLAQSVGMLQFAIELLTAARNYESMDGSPLDFTLNLIVLEKLMNEFGIHPSDAEAMEALRQLQPFQKNGKFDEAQAANFEELLGMNGFRSTDLLELVKYEIGFRKLKELVTRNYTASPFSGEKRYAAMYQTIKASTVALDLETFKKEAKVEDAEIQKRYDEQKDSFKTAEKRAVSWVLIPKPEGLDKIEDAAERDKKQAEYNEKARRFVEATYQPGAKLASVAAEHQVKVEKTELFEESSPPEALSDAAGLPAAIFALNPGDHPITDAKEGSKGYYIAELIQIEEPKQQELAAVKDQIRDTLVEQKAREAMATAINDAREFLAKGLKEGKKLADLAKEKKLTLSEVPEFDANTPPASIPNAYQIAQEAEAAAPGSVSKPVPTPAGVLLVIVNAKELRKREDAASTKEQISTSLTSSEREQIFQSWFGRQKTAADVKLQLRVG